MHACIHGYREMLILSFTSSYIQVSFHVIVAPEPPTELYSTVLSPGTKPHHSEGSSRRYEYLLTLSGISVTVRLARSTTSVFPEANVNEVKSKSLPTVWLVRCIAEAGPVITALGNV